MTHPIAGSCRLCGLTDPEVVLSLGEMPLANALVANADLGLPEARYPLDLGLCPLCGLVQITETVSSDRLFGDYLYFSSFSDTMVKHAKDLAESLIKERRLDGASLVVEAASNDGYLLQHYANAGVRVLGIEPAANVARVARERGIPTNVEFFTEALAARLADEGVRADVFHAHNVLAHVPDLHGFVEGIRRLLHQDGIAVLEVPYVRDMLERCEFDTIYHEHLCYFSLAVLHRLFKSHGLAICRVDRLLIHGGSLRIRAKHEAGAKPDESVARMLDEEEQWGATRAAPYWRFAARVAGIRRVLPEMLEGLRRGGFRIAAYGAAAKGSTLLNSLSLSPGLIEFVVDRSVYKQGRYMPGVHLPIYPTEKLMEARPDYVLLLTWNFAEEILAQQEPFRAQGGRFVLPIPEPTIL